MLTNTVVAGTVSNPAASGNQGVHKYVLSSSGAATYSYLLPMSEVESNKAAGTAKSNFVAVTAKARQHSPNTHTHDCVYSDIRRT